jgi:hypothetical protein
MQNYIPTKENPEDMGLLPKIWGPHMWESIHAIVFAYPVNPTEEDKQNYRNFFVALGFVLPCCYCSKSYSGFIRDGEHMLTDEALSCRDNLTRWVYDLHNRVNLKLETSYTMTYEMFCHKYNGYRAATCKMTPKEKSHAYIYGEIKEPPFLPYDFAKLFKNYAKQRGFNDFDEVITMTKTIYEDNLWSTKWHERNFIVLNIIKDMRLSAISNIELDGKFKGLPTIYELELIKRMSTTLQLSEINKIFEMLGQNLSD